MQHQRTLSVAICTWNRAELLRLTLQEMTRLAIPAGLTWELLVVNNNCTDATDTVIASFAARLPIRRLFQPQPGLSNARNLAVSEATGAYIAWTDDDVLVAGDWLTAYDRAFARWPEAAAFGGPVEPYFTTTPPAWLPGVLSKVASAYAIVDYGSDALPLTHDRVPFGANMAVRTDYQRAHMYDPDRGIRPGSRVGGEETHVVRAMLKSGATGWWVPGARVRHHIPAERQTFDYLRSYYFDQGDYVGRHDVRSGVATLFGRPRWLWKQALLAELRYRVWRHVRAPDAWIEDLIDASTARGQLRGYARPRPAPSNL
jgi:glycosyltransferase involved in cell wall biosynthesis